jgi:hypothetical protein
MQAPLQDRQHDGHQLADPAERPEHPHNCGVELRRAFEAGNPVPRQGGLQAGAVRLRQSGLIGIHPLQVGQ